MDPIIFQQRVNELCETARRNYPGSDRTQTPQEDSFRLVARPVQEICSDCGLCVEGRRVDYSLYQWRTKHPKWRKNCSICRKKTIVSCIMCK